MLVINSTGFELFRFMIDQSVLQNAQLNRISGLVNGITHDSIQTLNSKSSHPFGGLLNNSQSNNNNKSKDLSHDTFNPTNKELLYDVFESKDLDMTSEPESDLLEQ